MILSLRSLFPWTLLSIPLLCLGVTGCGEVDPPYSTAVIYPLRADPLVLSDKLGDERYVPDRPGVLPLLSIKEIYNPQHPMYPKHDTWQREGLLRDPTDIPSEFRQAINFMLSDLFGSPRQPRVGLISDSDRETLKLDEKTLAQGSVLYRLHCLHCHGVPGDGRGPTARWVNPHPRDFRQGIFKFQSVDQTSAPLPPAREDLFRTIRYGLNNTAMPAHTMLADEDIERLVSYVIHLSIRGKAEYETFKNNFEYDEANDEWTEKRPSEDYLEAMVKVIVPTWVEAQKPAKKIKIGAYPYSEGDKDALRKSVQRGQELFLGRGEEGKAANCVSCHKDYGRQATFRFDSWGTLVQPNNLTTGLYRGGRRTVDIYYRIHSGINGSGMASFGKTLKSESLWDLVNFVQVLPYPAMRRDLGITID